MTIEMSEEMRAALIRQTEEPLRLVDRETNESYVVLRSEVYERLQALQETARPFVRPGTGDWDAAMRAARELKDYDFDAWRQQRDYDQAHANDHLR